MQLTDFSVKIMSECLKPAARYSVLQIATAHFHSTPAGEVSLIVLSQGSQDIRAKEMIQK